MKLELDDKEVRTLKEALAAYVENRKKASYNGWPTARLELMRTESMLEKVIKLES